jgi:hypothetical protein
VTVFHRIFALLALITFVLVSIDTASAADNFSPPVGAPGPVAGAGLPVLAAIGYGAYWLVKRLRRKPD